LATQKAKILTTQKRKMLSTQKQAQLFDYSPVRNDTAKPLLKWAGGKGRLIAQISEFLPDKLATGEINQYAEPFIGGGALFFHIAQTYKNTITRFYISDANEELVILYLTIQREVTSLIEHLANVESHYFSLDKAQQKEFFLKTRKEYNDRKDKINLSNFSKDWIERAADIIFLNRTCFNGLFRVNSKGHFNVPFGDYNNPRICDESNLIAVSKVLEHTTIKHDDFAGCKDFVDKKTFVYFDPPYRPLTKTASFNSYSKEIFDDTTQERLAGFYRELDKKGVSLMLSNSDPKNVNQDDNYFDELYKGFNITRIKASRAINSNGMKRGQISELLITNY
jgi:DNA adenine methylase